MTPQETLHEISTMVYRNTDNFEMRISKDCYKSLISALEKQIPKKLIINEKDGMRHCPNCDTFFLSGGKRHCERCGQALDWSEVDG